MILYRIFLWLFRLGIGINALYNRKTKLWIAGRKNWRQKISDKLGANEKRLWIHCSSLGEFEQGRPLIESIKKQYPNYKIVLTFFSPSGFEHCKKYTTADYIFYLPMDGKRAAKDFVALINPSLVMFVKYEFWHYYLSEVCKRNIPLLLVSAAFRPAQAFFRWHGGFFRSMLGCFTQIHVQDDKSAKLLEGIGFKENVFVTGDTRYDRVNEIATKLRSIPEIEQYKANNKIIIAGSTWAADEQILYSYLPSLPQGWKMIIAPHEIDSTHINQLVTLFRNEAVLYSSFIVNKKADTKVLIIDNIGMLSSLYAYGNVGYVGGGFLKGGIHNTLEPAIFGLPIVFGPVYQKFTEAVSMVAEGVAFPVHTQTEAMTILTSLVNDEQRRDMINQKLKHFMDSNTGATERILANIRNKGWLS